MTGFITTISSPQTQIPPTNDPMVNSNSLLLTGNLPTGAATYVSDASLNGIHRYWCMVAGYFSIQRICR